MEIRERVIGPIAYVETAADSNTPEDELTRVDFGNLVRKLILFDRVLVELGSLGEVSLLVRKFGFAGVRDLLASGRIGFCAMRSLQRRLVKRPGSRGCLSRFRAARTLSRPRSSSVSPTSIKRCTRSLRFLACPNVTQRSSGVWRASGSCGWPRREPVGARPVED